MSRRRSASSEAAATTSARPVRSSPGAGKILHVHVSPSRRRDSLRYYALGRRVRHRIVVAAGRGAITLSTAADSGMTEGNAMRKRKMKPIPDNRAAKPRASAAAGDDTDIIALKLPPGPLSPEMEAYFAKCRGQARLRAERAQGLHLRHGEAFRLRRHVQRSDAGAVGPEQARARDDRGRGFGAQPLLLLPRRPWRRGASAFRRPGARRASW